MSKTPMIDLDEKPGSPNWLQATQQQRLAKERKRRALASMRKRSDRRKK